VTEPLRLAIELLAPLVLGGLPLPPGAVVQLGGGAALQLLRQAGASGPWRPPVW
jgi:hypothetical protein